LEQPPATEHHVRGIASNMAIFSVSDIVIAVTLIVNALALISTKLPGTPPTTTATTAPHAYERLPTADHGDDDVGSGVGGGGASTNVAADGSAESTDDYCSASTIAEQLMMKPASATTSAPTGGPIVTRLRSLVHGMRKYSCVIVVWNIFFVVLMVFVFGN
jgi:hypothetical protein